MGSTVVLGHTMASDPLSVSIGAKARTRPRYVIRAVVFQEGGS